MIGNKGAKRKLTGEALEQLFWAYFNNKMMILLMMIERPTIGRKTISVEKQRIFLNDLRHHFLSSHADRKYHNAFRWLGRFLNQYPHIKHKHIYKAILMVEQVYEAFGVELPARFEKIRFEREGIAGSDQSAMKERYRFNSHGNKTGKRKSGQSSEHKQRPAA